MLKWNIWRSPSEETPWNSAEIQVVKNSNLEESKQSSLEATKKFEFQVHDKVVIWSNLDKSVKIKSVRARSSRRLLQWIFWSEEAYDFSFYCKRIYRDCNSQKSIQKFDNLTPNFCVLISTRNLYVQISGTSGGAISTSYLFTSKIKFLRSNGS